MATTTKSKYIESHWLVFGVKGALASIAGLCLILNFSEVDLVTRLVGYFMIALGTIELINVFHRKRKQHAWGVPLAVSIIELFVAATLLFAAVPEFIMSLFPGADYAQIQGGVLTFRMVVLAVYTLYASISSIVIAFKSSTNKTDQFIWLMEGMFGAIMAFSMMGENGLDPNTHLRIFGVYLLVKGLTDLIFGAHSKELIDTAKAEKSAKKLAKKASKK